MQEQPQTEHKKQEACEGQGETFSGTPEQTIVEQPRSNKPKGGYFSKGKNWVSLFTLFFVGAYTVLTFCLLLTSRDTEKRQLRAYVGAGDIKITDNPSQITLTIENHGQTPARHVKVFSNWHDVPKRQDLPKDFTFPDTDECPDSLKSETVLYPKIPLPSVAETVNCNAVLAKIARGVSGQSTLYLYGHIEYSDIFADTHTTTFCLNWASGTSAYCDRHNEIDPQQ